MDVNQNPLISVVMSVYNSEKYLPQAIESIINQRYKNLEFIIINDGSKDNSLDIIKKYSSHDARIKVINQNNMGLTKSLNIGVAMAKGNYIARMDSDDISREDRFENFIDYMNKNHDIDIYSTPAYVINENNIVQKVIPNYFRRNGFDQKLLNYYNSMIHGTLIIKSEILKRFKYNEEYKYSQDFELYHRLLNKGHAISYDKQNISYMLRVHSKSISCTAKPEQLKLYRKIFFDNGLKFYAPSIKNKIIFRAIDFVSYLKKKFYR